MRVLSKSVSRIALVAAAGVLVGGVSAQAADLGGDCCADLEERVAELEATTARKGNRKVSLEVSGWVSQQVMFWDDGRESNVYVGQNTSTASRLRFVGSAKINPTWSAGYLLEFGVYTGASSFTMQQGPAQADDTPGTGYPAAASFLQLRHSAWYLDNKNYGRLWVGQTGQATDGIGNINLANTAVAGAHAKATQLDGAMRLRTVNNRALVGANQPNGMSAVTWGNARISGHGNPGDGDRLQVVKYVSPALMGFIFSAAWGEDDMWDVALRYAGEFSGFKIAAGIGYQQSTDGNNDGGNGILGCANARTAMANGRRGIGRSDVECEGLAGSASIMHVPTGLFVTGAAGYERDSRRSEAAFGAGIASNTQGTDSFWYLQAGIEQNWFGIGKTTLYGEYHNVNGGSVPASLAVAGGGVVAQDPLNSLNADAYIHGTHVRTWGFGMVQAIDAAAMDLFINYRVREADITLGRSADGTLRRSNAVEDLSIITAGGMIKF